MRLFKSHALGNDYLIQESGPPPTPALVRALCHRTNGVGSDGLLWPQPSAVADCGVRIFNPDGSEAEKSGNGLRIFARWRVDRLYTRRDFTVETLGGVVRCEVLDDGVRVEMGRARFEPEALPATFAGPLIDGAFPLGDEALTATALSVGNPHCVIFVEHDPELAPWRRWGEAIERHPRFPNRVNVQVAQVLGPDHLNIRIWERGAGETSASGSSSCAVAAAAVRTGRLRPGRIRLVMPGGTLFVTVSPSLDLTLEGAVTPIGELVLDPSWLAAALA